MVKPNQDSAAVCGLFCGTCPSFLTGECGGCLSQRCCCDCFNGFKDCAAKNGATRCYECSQFPCDILREFSTKHIINGIGHHKNVIADLQEMRETGVDAWVEKQTAQHTCAKCGQLTPWYQTGCDCTRGLHD